MKHAFDSQQYTNMLLYNLDFKKALENIEFTDRKIFNKMCVYYPPPPPVNALDPNYSLVKWTLLYLIMK